MSNTDDTVDIHGQEYVLIAARLRRFRDDHPDWTISTKLAFSGDFVRVKATIRDETGRKIATGHAEEEKGLGNINKTSYVENAETSAVGRALAFVSGEYAGKTIRSADEMADALHQQNALKLRLKEHNDAVKEHWDSITAIRQFVDEDNIDAAWEAWNEIPEADRMALKVAPTKGGWMRIKDKKALTDAAAQDFDPERGVYKSIADKEAAA